MTRAILLAALLAGGAVCGACMPAMAAGLAPEAIEKYVAEDTVLNVKISPTGEYYAMAVSLDGQVGLAIRRRSDNKTTATLRFGKDIHVHRFWWVSPDRVLVAMAQAFGTRDTPTPTGELFGMDASGAGRQLLVGWGTSSPELGSRIGSGGSKGDNVAAWLVDPLDDNDREVLVAVRALSGRDPQVNVDRMDVRTGARRRVAMAPVGNAGYVTDGRGQVRFAVGATASNHSQAWYRASDDAEWVQINDEAVSREVVEPLGFSADGRTAYLLVSQPQGPGRLATWDPDTRKRTLLPGDALMDPEPLHLDGTGRPIGGAYPRGPSTLQFFDDAAPESRLLRSLSAAFAGHDVRIASSTTDGRHKVVAVSSDVDPGSYYLFDTVEKNADLILSRKQGIDPARMSRVTEMTFKARDGLSLHGWLVKPASAGSGRLPLVVMPHGGPYDVRDAWTYDDDTQLLAEAGYAVLRVNFRGSGGYGRAFRSAGAREWGGAMQDDLTDATRWAIDQGIADPSRICIYGASYGGYASLMGVAKEPSLYRCAVGYIGIYDLPRRQVELATRATRSTLTWSRDWMGSDTAALAKVSPVNLADRIEVPVLLVAGGQDLVAPVEHTERMESALRKAGKRVETYYVPTEGHGFHLPQHRREFYRRLLDFLDRNIGAKRQAAG